MVALHEHRLLSVWGPSHRRPHLLRVHTEFPAGVTLVSRSPGRKSVKCANLKDMMPFLCLCVLLSATLMLHRFKDLTGGTLM